MKQLLNFLACGLLLLSACKNEPVVVSETPLQPQVSNNGTLTREKAKAVLMRDLGYPKDEVITFHLSLSPYHYKQSDYQELIDSGYIRTPVKTTGIDFMDIQLTDKGSAFVRGKDPYEDDAHFMMKGAESRISNITGLSERGNNKTYWVDYVVTFGGLNAFGRFYRKTQVPEIFTQSHAKHDLLVLYDDGWRVGRK